MNSPTPHAVLHDALPDIARRPHSAPQGALDWVGMNEVHQAVRMRLQDEDLLLPANVTVYVDLDDPYAKGIHMSRLYLLLDEHTRGRPLSAAGVQQLLRALHQSHADTSSRAYVRFQIDYPLRRAALVSDHQGWNVYPVTVCGTWENGEATLELGVRVTYSSTCPCSAALARQLIQQAFDDHFANGKPFTMQSVRAWLGTEEGIAATPHSQRSHADVLTRLAPAVDVLPIEELIDVVEHSLGTPVQTAVKREDEQAFARLNGENLMFCEDAARRLQAALSQDGRFTDFRARVEHHESLHPHNAVAVTTKGIVGGYTAAP